jgi:thiamine biosynthesis lipoprotein
MLKKILWLSLVLGLLGCGSGGKDYQRKAYAFGTLVEITVTGVPDEQAKDAVDRVFREFDRLHAEWHPWQPGPMEDINAALARGETVPITTELSKALSLARKYADRSDNFFNPAIGNLVRLWGFHAEDFAEQLPDPAAIKAQVAAAPTMRDLKIGKDTLSSSNPQVRIDLGGFAKGYALDVAEGILRQHGIRYALINIGGNILAMGKHGDRPWVVGVQNPRGKGIIARYELGDGEAIGTSGDYQRYFFLDGKRYFHIIDPFTGYPADGTQAVTVVAKGDSPGSLSDAASKPIFIAGQGAWETMATKLKIMKYMRIDANGAIYVSKAFSRGLKWESGMPRPVVVGE